MAEPNGWDPTRIKGVLFDLDGTLLDSRTAVVGAVAAGAQEVLRRHGIEDADPTRQSIEDAMGLPSDAYYRQILPDNLQHLASEVQAASTRHEVTALENGEGRLHPGVLDTLAHLKQSGRRLGVVSNAQAPYFRAALHCLKLLPLLDHAECYEEMPPGDGPSKPRLIARALPRLELPAPAVGMVGDRDDDIHAGIEHGCATLGLTYGFGSAEELAAADLVSDRFTILRELLP